MTDPASPQDPLPEASFPWRRALTFALTAAILWGLWAMLPRVPAADLLPLAQALLLTLALVLILYFGGASAADLAGLVAAVRVRIGLPPAAPPRSPADAPD